MTHNIIKHQVSHMKHISWSSLQFTNSPRIKKNLEKFPIKKGVNQIGLLFDKQLDILLNYWVQIQSLAIGGGGGGGEKFKQESKPPPSPHYIQCRFLGEFLSIAVSFQLQILIVVYTFLLTQTALDIKKVHSCP